MRVVAATVNRMAMVRFHLSEPFPNFVTWAHDGNLVDLADLKSVAAETPSRFEAECAHQLIFLYGSVAQR